MGADTYRPGSVVFDNWILGEEIGSGSYGRVFSAERRDLGEVYRAAVKIITVPRSQSEFQSIVHDSGSMEAAAAYCGELVRNLEREFSIMFRLRGRDNIVSCDDYRCIAHADGCGWDILIRMELLQPLKQHAQHSRMSRRDIIRLGIDMCRALELCQQYNVIHRDIKPDNIFYSESGCYKLGDFGIARTVEETASAMSEKGTYSYMAPEVCRCERYGFSVDTYSLGLVLYQMLNRNRLPFLPYDMPITPGIKERALQRRMSGEELPEPYYAHGRLGEIVCKACAFDARDRYSSPMQMRQELEAILYKTHDAELIYPEGDSLSIPPMPPGPPTTRPRRSRAWVWLLSAAVCLAVAAGGLVVWRYVQLQNEARIQREEERDQRSETLAQQEQEEAAQAEQRRQRRYAGLMEEADALCRTDPESALASYEEAQGLYPKKAEAYVGYAYALYCAGSYDACCDYIEDDLALGKRFEAAAQDQLYAILGAAYFEQGDYAAAASAFRTSTAGGDITVDTQRDYAVSLGRLGDVDAADEILQEMYAAGASGDVTDYVQAEVQYAKKEYLTAESGFQSVLASTDDPALQRRALRALAELYRDCAGLARMGDSPIVTPATKEAELLADGIERYGLRYDATLWEMLGLAYFDAYHTDTNVPQDYLRRAADCFRRVIELGVTKDYLYSNLYTIYYELGDYENAEQALRDYSAQFPAAYEPHAFRAMMYITQENGKNAADRDYSAAYDEYQTAKGMLRSGDDTTYFQQLEGLVQQLQSEGWL